ncbi:helix-turn-helix domain-containing protein [Streptomyces chartreusis]|uniref:helix-turn-helix domain-containing protein n=1 Tax=Streptomyces chartreusis TaxID=1969 RepID=UPI0036957521
MDDDVKASPIDRSVGSRLRELRLERKLSAREVAEAAQVSPSYLSRLEHGKVSPTVATLARVVQAMGESVARVFGDREAGPLVRKADRRVVHNRGAVDEIVTPVSATRLEVLETTVAPGAGSGSEPYHHPGDEECVLVLEGALAIWLGVPGQKHLLEKGDAVTFPCRTPHRWENPGTEPARVLWVITPAGY